MKRFTKYLAVSLLLMAILCSPAFSSTYRIIDQGDNILVGATHSRNNNVIYGPVEHVGSEYNTHQVDISIENGGLAVEITTEFSGLGQIVRAGDNEVADFFFDFNRDGAYEFGVDLSYNGGLTSAGIYALDSWITSWDIFNSASGTSSQGGLYGGWMEYSQDGGDIIVDFNQQTSEQISEELSSLSLDFDQDSGLYTYKFSIEEDLITAMGVDLNEAFGFFFGTAECGNDIVSGSTVPEPSTVVLFLTGLLGMSAVTRKKS